MEGKKDIITVAVVNFKAATGDKEQNLARMKGFSVAAAKRGADLVLFPEMCLMGYDYFINEEIKMEEKIAATETLQGPSCTALSEIAKEYGIYIVFGAAEKKEGSDILYNSAYAVGPDGFKGAYQKMHPFETESIWCEKGENPFMIDTEWGPISVGICFDTYQFPELMRYYVSKGSRLYLNPTAVIEEIPKECSRQAFINYYAPTLEYGVLCNTIFIASANLTGFDDTNYFGGGSAVIGPKINPFFETDVTYYAGDKDNVQEGIYLSTIDLSLATRPLFVKSKYTGTPDYRPELYKKFL
ncbi:carbon-nitrogen hydrolase family protein [Sinanaerobacter chloroacetimidivorans]|uniref:Carbon-nitrogen hydrolase family protein n=1 Tax=Sinanaerobacter chloroacetimidivorans TaxID=2818044 RepID=A0A8J7VY44_9FIRM|nr:carbon-nitrogen hydrolase family protein [Sinanaerobacter chloroacetimidivorans]MBR0597222.1 carbon-nitrogen hydrolase family protein [Sinanaerobacter chloroacetimidivorans]